MFKSFFPKPGMFFLSAFVWALIAVIFWQVGGGDWVARITGASGRSRLAPRVSGRWIS